MKPRSLRILSEVCRLILGATFLLSGFTKAVSYTHLTLPTILRV